MFLAAAWKDTQAIARVLHVAKLLRMSGVGRSTQPVQSSRYQARPARIHSLPQGRVAMSMDEIVAGAMQGLEQNGLAAILAVAAIGGLFLVLAA